MALDGMALDGRPAIEWFTPRLTGREAEILVLIARGDSNHEIADCLVLSLDTVKTHVKHIYAKCGARNRAHAVIAAYESGVVTRPGGTRPSPSARRSLP